MLLLFTVHWSACALRLLTSVVCDLGRGPHSRGRSTPSDVTDADGECPNTVLTTGYNWGDGVWATYVEAAVWANMALNGEATRRAARELFLTRVEGQPVACIYFLGARRGTGFTLERNRRSTRAGTACTRRASWAFASCF